MHPNIIVSSLVTALHTTHTILCIDEVFAILSIHRICRRCCCEINISKWDAYERERRTVHGQRRLLPLCTRLAGNSIFPPLLEKIFVIDGVRNRRSKFATVLGREFATPCLHSIGHLARCICARKHGGFGRTLSLDKQVDACGGVSHLQESSEGKIVLPFLFCGDGELCKPLAIANGEKEEH